MLKKVKLALRITTTAFDDELNDLIYAAKADLKLAGIPNKNDDPLYRRAVVTYCRYHFGQTEDADRLKASYDEQKAQLQMATGDGFPEEGV